MRKFIRSMDELGRIVIPKEIRTGFNLTNDSQLNIEIVNGGILLSPLDASCIICGRTENLILVDGIAVCRDCATRLGQLAKEADNANT